MLDVNDLSKEELWDLLTDAAKNWLAHDGLWFLAVENKYGLEIAIELDRQAWHDFAIIEARRILKRLNIAPGGGMQALAKVFDYRMYAFINKYQVDLINPHQCVFTMKSCHVQEARKRKGLPAFPCKPVGSIEFSQFVCAIDPRIQTRCIACPPDEHSNDEWCSWEFTLHE